MPHPNPILAQYAGRLPFSRRPTPRLANPTAIDFKDRAYLFREQLPCFWCQKLLCRSEATIDHLKPTAQGGKNCSDNKAICCKQCNEERGLITVAQIQWWRAKETKTNHARRVAKGAMKKAKSLIKKFRRICEFRGLPLEWIGNGWKGWMLKPELGKASSG